jgi:hypothetical protein
MALCSGRLELDHVQCQGRIRTPFDGPGGDGNELIALKQAKQAEEAEA